MKTTLFRLSTCTALSLLLFACSDKPHEISEKGTAMPPPKQALDTNLKGLNLASPTLPPPSKVAVRDDDDVDPNPAPQVVEADTLVIVADDEMAPANMKPDTDARLARLEAAVASLRADYDQIVPTFKTLSVNTDRLVSLLDQIEGQETSMVKPAAGPKMMSAGHDGDAHVTAVRFGAHPDKTRLVLDVSNLTGYSYDLDNQEGVLVVSLPEAGWSAGAQKGPINSDVVSGWGFQASPDGGAAMIVQLKGPVEISGQNALPANGDKSPRIYLDITGV